MVYKIEFYAYLIIKYFFSFRIKVGSGSVFFPLSRIRGKHFRILTTAFFLWTIFLRPREEGSDEYIVQFGTTPPPPPCYSFLPSDAAEHCIFKALNSIYNAFSPFPSLFYPKPDFFYYIFLDIYIPAWCTMPDPGGTISMFLKALAPHLRNMNRSRFLWNSSSSFLDFESPTRDTSTWTLWSMTRSAGHNGLITLASPPSS